MRRVESYIIQSHCTPLNIRNEMCHDCQPATDNLHRRFKGTDSPTESVKLPHVIKYKLSAWLGFGAT